MEVTWGFQDPRLFFLQLRTDVSDSGSGRSSLRTQAEQKHQRAASAKPFPYPPAGAPTPPRRPSRTQGVEKGQLEPRGNPRPLPQAKAPPNPSSRGGPSCSIQQAGALAPQPARENLGGNSALSIPPPARKQSPGKQQAAPWEALLEVSGEEPRMGAQAGCRGRERQRHRRWSTQLQEAGRMGKSQRGIWKGRSVCGKRAVLEN